MKILIDTNIYFDFYRAKTDALRLFDEMVRHNDSIILTDQIIHEFERGREGVIKKVKQLFEHESKLPNNSSSFLQSLPEFQQLIDIQRAYKTKQLEVTNVISEILNNPVQDPVATFFKEFVDSSMLNNRVLETTDEIIKLAHKRKLVGNPPTSDKYSIGDEINWEIILANIEEDIIIVGRDNTFNNNLSFLQRDFHKRTGHFIVKVTDSITTALREIGVATSDALVEAEESQIEEISHFGEFWRRRSSDL